MRISVLIPAYNCAATIRATLDSVLRQTLPADEILVMDDGSTDETASILTSYRSSVVFFSQPNRGVASARNTLIARAQGDLVAFLDSDDIWHPKYLETQCTLFERYPHAVASFVDHANFCGLDSYSWDQTCSGAPATIETFGPLSFFRRFESAPGPFVMSFCCVPRRIFRRIGDEPFRLRVAEDVFFCGLMPFLGEVVFASAPQLAAYRIREGSLASNRLNCVAGEVDAFELLQERYRNATDRQLAREFGKAFASRRRAYGKILLGVGRTAEAQGQLLLSFRHSNHPISWAKSTILLLATYLPKFLQPTWPPVGRQWESPDHA